jgi:hypothetical protein
MQEWELRYRHMRDMQKVQCGILGIKIPKTEYGVLKVISEIQRSFDGSKFCPKFRELGHDVADFNLCRCKCK